MEPLLTAAACFLTGNANNLGRGDVSSILLNWVYYAVLR